MGDNVKKIEDRAFLNCRSLRFIRLSKRLEHIGYRAFRGCILLEALFLPSTVKSIKDDAFENCPSLKLMILPNDIDLNNVGKYIIYSLNAGILSYYAGSTRYEWIEDEDGIWNITDESSRRVNEWLFHHMDGSPFHKLCYNSSITAEQINSYVTENGDDVAAAIDPSHGMTPLHMLAMNPYASTDAIASLFNSNMQAVFCLDNQQKTPLDYARDYNVGGLVGIINGLCNHRNSSILLFESGMSLVNTSASE